MKIYIYKNYGERLEPKVDDIHISAFLVGKSDDIAICKAKDKVSAINKLKTYYNDEIFFHHCTFSKKPVLVYTNRELDKLLSAWQ